jgi:hypothetical protein
MCGIWVRSSASVKTILRQPAKAEQILAQLHPMLKSYSKAGVVENRYVLSLCDHNRRL